MSIFNKCCQEMSQRQKSELHPYIIPDKKFNSKLIKDLNARPEIRKFLTENMRVNF